MQLQFTKPKAEAELPFSWPVDAKNYHVKVRPTAVQGSSVGCIHGDIWKRS